MSDGQPIHFASSLSVNRSALGVGFVLNGTHAAGHVEHCLNYLRQVILCHADTTVEPAHCMESDVGVEPASNGIGVVHTCKDWKAVNNFVQANPVKLPERLGDA